MNGPKIVSGEPLKIKLNVENSLLWGEFRVSCKKIYYILKVFRIT